MSESRENQQEKERFDSVSIPQQFAWTSLSSNQSNKDGETSIWLQDLLLWTVLGFAVDDCSYYTLCLVCKEWHRMVHILEPPVVIQMSRLLASSDTNLGEDKLELYKAALESLKNRQSSLYRSMPTAAWPNLQPRFNVTLMQFVYQMATQRAPNSHVERLYEITASFFQEVAIETVQRSRQVMTDPQDASEMIKLLIKEFNSWQGLVETVDGVANYLNRYYAPHHSLKHLKSHAQTCLAQSVVNILNPDIPGQALTLGADVDFDENEAQRRLLLDAWRACETLRGYEWPAIRSLTSVRDQYVWLEASLEATLERARDEETTRLDNDDAVEDEDANEQALSPPITIISKDGQRTTTPHDSHFITSSGFLNRLKLDAGDIIKLSVDHDVLEKAVEFCGYDQETPMPEIQTPLRSNDMRELVGEPYGNFVMDLSVKDFFRLTLVANLLDLPKLLNLCCAGVALHIRGRTLDEIRASFNVRPDD